jgi:hypothetical protein
MTIAAGFVCSDGLLFASDTLYSGEERVSGDKFWTFSTDHVALVYGGAGTSTGLQCTINEIEHRLKSAMRRWDVLQTIQASLKSVDKLLELEPWNKTQLLVGTREDGKTQLHENDGGSYGLSRIQRATQCVGAGYSLGRYFARSLFHPNMSIKWAEIVAAHLIKNVKAYDEQRCGGDTHLFALPNDGDIREIRDQSYIAGLENHLTEVEKALHVVLPSDEPVTDYTLEQRLMGLTEVIRNLSRAQYVGLSGVQANTGQGKATATSSQPLGSSAIVFTGHKPETQIASTTPSEPETPKDPGAPPDPTDPKDEK